MSSPRGLTPLRVSSSLFTSLGGLEKVPIQSVNSGAILTHRLASWRSQLDCISVYKGSCPLGNIPQVRFARISLMLFHSIGPEGL